MVKRLRSIFPLDLMYILEASVVLLFFVQALRYAIGAMYARIGSASIYPALDPALIDPTMPGLVDPATVTGELTLFAYMIALTLVAFLLGRWHVLIVPTAGLAAIGRYVMAAGGGTLPDVTGAALTIGAGFLYIALLVRHRAVALPYAFIFAISADQLYRAWGDTLDPSWSPRYLDIQLILTAFLVIFAIITFIRARSAATTKATDTNPHHGLMSLWGGVALGALLFLQFSLLALPNAIGGRSGTNLYTLLVPAVLVATLLPIIPAVRMQARRFISLFDSGLRGWVWMLMTMLLIVIGTRLGSIIAAASLVAAQFMMSMMWWWLYRPRARKERDFSALWVLGGALIFIIFSTFDIFTYEYAYVRDFAPPLEALNPVVPSLLRGFRGLGLAVILLAVFLSILPMVFMQKRIAWAPGLAPRYALSVLGVMLIAVVGTVSVYFSRPPVVTAVIEPQVARIGTYNIHAGFNEFFYFDLEMIARTIEFSGANVVLLQEVEIGRMTSFGVDQALWLARRLGMDARFFPTNEGVQGLAVISNIPIVFDDGVLLTSPGNQTGLQRVQVLPDDNVITLYNTWLEPLLETSALQSITQLEAAQDRQLTEVIATIARHHPDGRFGRMVIGGTFNNIPDSDLIRRVAGAGFDDPFADQQPELAATFRRTGVQARLDYLWTTVANNFQVVESGVINDFSRQIIPHQPSDHLLAMVVVRLR